MKIQLHILKEDDPTPIEQEYYDLFEKVKSKMEASLTKYANKGILPNVNEQLVAIHPDNCTTEYIVISRFFYEDFIRIWVEWE